MNGAQINFVGNVTRDPDLRFTNTGRPVAKFGVAVSRRIQENGEWRDSDPSFFEVTAWSRLGENCAESLSKGTRVAVSGRIEQRSYTTDEGVQRTVFDVTADTVAVDLTFVTVEVHRVERTPVPTGDSDGLFD